MEGRMRSRAVLVPLLALIAAAPACEPTGFEGPRPADSPSSTEDDVGTPAPSTSATPPVAYPLILAHGFISSAAEGFDAAIVTVLEQDGHRVFRTEVPPIASVLLRAQALATQVDAVLAETGADKVHLIAHSMGGLDCRALISGLGYADRVASLTTISTPHRGSALADVGLGLSNALGLEDEVLDLLSVLVFGVEGADDPNLRAAMIDLAESNAETFNARYPDAPGVYYQSWAGLSNVAAIEKSNDESACVGAPGAVLQLPEVRDRLRPLFVATAPVVAHFRFDANDGVVTVNSARWGRFRGCVPADHFDETESFTDPDTGFSLQQFYRDVARELAAGVPAP
jgi:triacylglycerol lipase